MSRSDWGRIVTNAQGVRCVLAGPAAVHWLKLALRGYLQLARVAGRTVDAEALELARWLNDLDAALKVPAPDDEPGLDEVLTAAEAARRLKVSTRRVQELAANGRIPGARRATGVNGGPGPWLIPAVSVALRGFAHARTGVTSPQTGGTVNPDDQPAPTRPTG